MNEKDAVYFWLESGEDGTSIEVMTKHQLAHRLKESVDLEIPHTFLRQIPRNDKGCWVDVDENAVVIIKGEIVVPTSKAVVQQYEVP